MSKAADQILSVARMRAAEDALVARGVSVTELMDRAGRGAADWVWRMATGHKVTVLCGPGNNGGDGYVIAEAIRERGGRVAVMPAAEPATDAARNARALYRGELLPPGADPHGEVLVDCLFGSGLTRPLSDEHVRLLAGLAANHRHAVAIDLPSGVDADSGAILNPELPSFDVTLALGAWKFAHFIGPARPRMGALRLVEIGIEAVPDAARALAKPRLRVPDADTHKYRRGLLAIVAGEMPGAAVLAARAAQGAGAGYVKLLIGQEPHAPGWGLPGAPASGDSGAAAVPPDIVADRDVLADALADPRIGAVLVGPGLGRHADARERLGLALAAAVPTVLDADGLHLLGERQLAERTTPLIATPHEGELSALEAAFDCTGEGTRVDRAQALAMASGMIVVAKGPATVIAAPDGRLVCAPPATSWLSTAGTGDVLAGTIASRLATGADPFAAACEGVWLHGEAARGLPPAFSASALSSAISIAYADCL